MSAVQEYSETLRKFFFTDTLRMRIFDPLLDVDYITKFCIQGKCFSRVKAVLVLQRDFNIARKLIDFGIQKTIVMLELLCFDWLWQTCYPVIMRVDLQKNITLCVQTENFRSADLLSVPAAEAILTAENFHDLCADLLFDVMVPTTEAILSAETLCDMRNILIAPNILTLVRIIYEDGS
jgi:hypothetical protein